MTAVRLLQGETAQICRLQKNLDEMISISVLDPFTFLLRQASWFFVFIFLSLVVFAFFPVASLFCI